MFQINRFDFLVSLYTFLIVSADYLGAKTFPVAKLGSFQLNASVAIFLVPFIFTINDMIIEVYGKARAKSVVRSSLVIVALLFLFSWLVVSLPPSARFASSEDAYHAVFAKSMRFSLASLIAFAVSEFTDIAIFARIRERMKAKALWFRNNISNFSAQFLDTVVFISLAFYALERPFGDNAAFLWSIILPYWALKCVMSVVETPFVYWGVKWLKKGTDNQ